MVVSITPNLVSFTSYPDTSKKSKREHVEDAATVTGGVGAGAAATRGGAMKFFKSAEKINRVSSIADQTSRALEAPVRQTNSLWNAMKLNYNKFTKQISRWAEASNMPKFMKGIFTGKLGAIIGGGAAVFVFITGIGEVIRTASNNIYTLSAKASFDNNN